ncbi:MAG: hypothetical protein KJO49_08260 [Bacteroidia bacterium]|nr:hypothetical protein [Bacteroidia bacterium]
MHWLKRLFQFYIISNIHVALAVCCLVVITLLNFGMKIDIKLMGFIFFGTVSSYNFVKYFGLARFHHKRLAPWLRHIQIFAFLAFIAMLAFAVQLKPKTLMAASLIGMLTFLYSIPILPRQWFLDKKSNLRAISGLKIYIIALVWTGVAVFLPIIDGGHPIGYDVWIYATQIYLYVWVATLPFEIRDLQYDSLKLATIPQQIGLNATKFLGMILLVVVVLLEFFKDDYHPMNPVIVVLVMAVTALFLMFSKKLQGQYYSSFWVEGIPMLWLGLILWLY